MELSGINKKLPKDTVHKISDNTGFHGHAILAYFIQCYWEEHLTSQKSDA